MRNLFILGYLLSIASLSWYRSLTISKVYFFGVGGWGGLSLFLCFPGGITSLISRQCCDPKGSTTSSLVSAARVWSACNRPQKIKNPPHANSFLADGVQCCGPTVVLSIAWGSLHSCQVFKRVLQLVFLLFQVFFCYFNIHRNNKYINGSLLKVLDTYSCS